MKSGSPGFDGPIRWSLTNDHLACVENSTREDGTWRIDSACIMAKSDVVVRGSKWPPNPTFPALDAESGYTEYANIHLLSQPFSTTSEERTGQPWRL